MTQFPNQVSAVSAPDSSESRSSYVLVVDDESVVRDFLTRCLDEWGYAVKQAGTAAEALEMMVADPASLVLCDIRLPGHDGLWLTQRLRELWPQTAVIMATGLDDAETVRQSRNLGAVDFLNKPISVDRLRYVVNRAIGSPQTDESPDERAAPAVMRPAQEKIEAEYTLETPVRCPACGERVVSLKAVRLVRAQVNFTSTLPRRGRVVACPYCLAIVPAELTNF